MYILATHAVTVLYNIIPNTSSYLFSSVTITLSFITSFSLKISVSIKRKLLNEKSLLSPVMIRSVAPSRVNMTSTTDRVHVSQGT